MSLYRHRSFGHVQNHIHYGFVYFLAIVMVYHTLLVSYATSSFAGTILSPSAVGVLHGLAALVSTIFFLIFPYILNKIGNVMTGIGIMGIAIIALFFMAFGGHPIITLCALFLFLVVNPITYLTIDVFSETLIGKNETDTGAKRGLILSLMSLGAVFAPLSMGILLTNSNDFTQLFLASAGIGLLFIAVIIGIFRQFYDPVYKPMDLSSIIKTINLDKNLKTVMGAHFLLQLFFCWTIIYIPLYLLTIVELSWEQISYVIAAGLVAYVVFEYPIGRLADKKFGEKEMMALGFVVLALSVGSLAFMVDAPLYWLMILMFINRFGASLVEVTTESYFFKKVNGQDAALMGIFRLLRPSANVLGALLGGILLMFVSFPFLFIIYALILVIGCFIPRYLEDTR